MPYMNGLDLANEISKINQNIIIDQKKHQLNNISVIKKIKIYLLTADEPSEELKIKNKFDDI